MANGKDTTELRRVERPRRPVNGKRVAYKCVNLSRAVEQEDGNGTPFAENAFMEVQILDYFRRHPHSNVLGSINAERVGAELCITMPLAKGDLLELLQFIHEKRISLRLETKKTVIADILSGVQHLHKCGIVHRDISAENILVLPGNGDQRDRCVISDFGLASQIEVENGARLRPATDIVPALRDVGALPVPEAPVDGPHPAHFRRSVGKPCYMAPEIWRGEKHCAMKADAFAVGVVLFMIFAASNPFERASPADNCYTSFLDLYYVGGRVRKFARGEMREFPGDSLDLVLSLLHPDPAKRLSVAEACEHPFVKAEVART